MNSVSDEKINDILFKQIKKVTLVGKIIFPLCWTNQMPHYLNRSLKNGTLDKELFLSKLHNQILKDGRYSYNQLTEKEMDPGDINSPNALAYAIKHSEFTDSERKSCEYFIGLKEDIFLLMYYQVDLITYVFEQLLRVNKR